MNIFTSIISALKSKYNADGALTPAAYNAMRQREVVSLEKRYDLNTIQGIQAISIPKKKTAPGISPSVTGQIEYYLQRKGGTYEADGKIDLAIACYRKANELMPFSGTSYSLKDYMRLPRYLRKLRRFDEAREEEAKIEVLFKALEEKLHNPLHEQLQTSLSAPWLGGSDLIEVSFVSACCEICGKYRGRIFSTNGKDPRFPRLPLDFHEECGCSAFPFIYGVNEPQYIKSKDIIEYCNKPLRDMRTKAERELYADYLHEQEVERVKLVDQTHYDWLWEHMPDICPKSFGGYRRMKSSNSTNFQKICRVALENGRDILK